MVVTDNALAIEIKDIHKTYKGADTPALNGFSLSVNERQIVGLLGPNGAGKTTCFNILCGIVRPDSGAAKIEGKDCITDADNVHSLIGMVPQQIALFGELTAMENFRYLGRLYNVSKNTLSARISYLQERLGLAKHAHKKINSYSGGMKRRANIIASLLHEPQLLLLDEPTAGVDVQSRAVILDFLKEYRQKGNTILYTSHLLDEAEQVCDEVVIIDEGRYVAGGTPKSLVAQTPDCRRLEDVFLHYTGRSLRD